MNVPTFIAEHRDALRSIAAPTTKTRKVFVPPFPVGMVTANFAKRVLPPLQFTEWLTSMGWDGFLRQLHEEKLAPEEDAISVAPNSPRLPVAEEGSFRVPCRVDARIPIPPC
eukprot:Polyplicarium_translucidae@DN2122_c0_g1_i3.p2